MGEVGFFDLLGEGFRCVYQDMQQSLKPLAEAGDWVVDRVDDAAGWVDDMWHGNVGDQAMSTASVDDQPVSVEDLVPTIHHGAGTADWHAQATRARDLSADHEELSARIREVAEELGYAWQGKAADGARARMQPLIDAARSAGETFAGNATSVESTAAAFDEMKPRIENLPGRPPHKNFADIITPWDTDTERSIAAYNASAQRNLEHYRNYDSAMQDYRSQLRTDYGWIEDYDGGNVTLVPATARGPATHHVPPPAAARRPEVAHPRSAPSTPHPRSAMTTPHNTAPHNATPPNEQDVHDGSPPDNISPSQPPSPPPSAPGQASGETDTAGYLPEPEPQVGAPARPTGTSLPDSPGNASGPTAPGLPNIPGREPALDAEPGRGGAISGGAIRAGDGTVNRTTTNSPAAEGRGAAGAPGASGVGAGGRDEDREHKRKYGRDDKALFTDDDASVDPQTGLRTAPPTLGS